MATASPDTTPMQPLVTSDPAAFGLAGVILDLDPDDAADLGAFPEDALSLEDAWDSNTDEERT